MPFLQPALENCPVNVPNAFVPGYDFEPANVQNVEVQYDKIKTAKNMTARQKLGVGGGGRKGSFYRHC